MADMQDAIKKLQKTAIVMSAIQARQAEVRKGQGEWLEQHEKRMQRLETNLAEAGEKLNALISVVEDSVRRNGGQKQ
jgi:hypothetical protein